MSHTVEHFTAALAAVFLTTTTFISVTTVPEAPTPYVAAPAVVA